MKLPAIRVWDDDTGLNHRSGGDGRAAAAEPDEAHREARDAGAGTAGQHFGRWLGRYFYRVFHGECGRGIGAEKNRRVQMLPNDRMDALFEATVQATEEAVVNALVAAKTMTGADGHTVEALPHDRLREVLKKYNRLVEAK